MNWLIYVLKDSYPVRIEVRSCSLARIAEVSELVNVEAVKAVRRDVCRDPDQEQGGVFRFLVQLDGAFN